MLKKYLLLGVFSTMIVINHHQCLNAADRPYLLEQVKNTAVIQVYADDFSALTLEEKKAAYYLYLAAVAGINIAYDQRHRHGVAIKNLLEGIYRYAGDIDAEVRQKLGTYTKLFWINKGQYYDRTKRKFTPEVPYDALKRAARTAVQNGADLGMPTGATLDNWLESLQQSILDPDYEPILTAKSPEKNLDLITGSANNFYHGVTLSEVETLHEKNPLNSRVVKKNGRIFEQVYRTGTGHVPPGLYAEELNNICRYLQKAIEVAAPEKKKVLRTLIHFFQTGDLEDFKTFNIAWLQDRSRIDFINGFIEVYTDSRGAKGEYEAMVNYVDMTTTQLMETLAGEALYFEQRMPWDDKYKKESVQAAVASSIAILVGTGGLGPTTPAGINLPNEQEIREQYGTKSVYLSTVQNSLQEAVSAKALDEFALPEHRELLKKYSTYYKPLHVALHEVVGHASGKVNSSLIGEPAVYLKEYYSTLEEARAELVALWHMFDRKLLDLGLLPSMEASEATYAAYPIGALMELRRIPEGNRIDDDHIRAEHLIVNYLREVKNVIQDVRERGKLFLKVTDYKKMREGVGELLAEIMRIKAEGDYTAAQQLVENYGITINTVWRDEIVQRCHRINYPQFYAFTFPNLEPVKDDDGSIIDIRVTYPASLAEQQLWYSQMEKQMRFNEK